MTFNALTVSISDYVATVHINVPAKANALDVGGWREVRDCMESLDVDSNVRVIILTSIGTYFCAGIDISVLSDLQRTGHGGAGRTARHTTTIIKELQDCISSIERCRKPVIAAVQGACIGGGVDLVAACDMRYCSDEAYFTIKEVDLGLIADLGTLQRLPYVLNAGRLAELAYTGRKLDGSEAASIGLVNESYPSSEDLDQKVQALAQQIAGKSPLIIQGIKETLLYQRDQSVRAGLDRVATLNGAYLHSDDLKQALIARQKTQTPEFEDL